MKCDIEGAEAPLFRRMQQWEDRVHYVILELHTEFLSAREFHACLATSRYHWRIDGTIPAQGVLAVIGLGAVANESSLAKQARCKLLTGALRDAARSKSRRKPSRWSPMVR